jgi:hypothetical protein
MAVGAVFFWLSQGSASWRMKRETANGPFYAIVNSFSEGV